MDLQNIAVTRHYLMCFDTAVIAYWRAMELPYERARSASAASCLFRKATLEYKSPVLFDRLDIVINVHG